MKANDTTHSIATLNTTEQKSYQGGSVQPVNSDLRNLIDALIDQYMN